MDQQVQHPLISVIVPVYNAEQYVEQCLESICSQTYPHLEIICIDDGSTDSSAAILHRYAERDKRVQVLTRKNRGQAAARNEGLEIARGEWVTGVDADDYLRPGAYEYAVGMIAPGVDVVCFSSSVAEGSAVNLREDEVEYLSNLLDGVVSDPGEVLRSTNVYFWNKLWRRSFLEEHGLRFNEGMWYEDSAFAYCALPLARAVAYGSRAVHCYRIHDHSTMTSTFTGNRRVLEHLEQLDLVLDFYRRKGVDATLPEAEALVFRNLYNSAMFHLSPQLKPEGVRRAAEIARKYDLYRKFPYEGSINSARVLPWYLRPFLRFSRSGKMFRFFWIPVFSIRFSEKLISWSLFNIRLASRRLAPPQNITS